MIKRHQCSFCKKVAICINADPSRREHKRNKKGEWYTIKGYWLCKSTCYKHKQLSGEMW